MRTHVALCILFSFFVGISSSAGAEEPTKTTTDQAAQEPDDPTSSTTSQTDQEVGSKAISHPKRGPIALEVSRKLDYSDEDPFSPRNMFSLKGVQGVGLLDLDAKLLQTIIRQRLSQVQVQLLRDLLEVTQLGELDARPLADLFESLSGLAFGAFEGETRSQTLIAALTRDGLSYGIAWLAEADAIERFGCGGSDEAKRPHVLASAAYEAIATSPYFGALGFPRATGNPPSGCADFATHVRDTIHVITRLGMEVFDSDFFEEVESQRTKVKTACAPLVTLFESEGHQLDTIASFDRLGSLVRTRMKDANTVELFNSPDKDKPAKDPQKALETCRTAVDALRDTTTTVFGVIVTDTNAEFSIEALKLTVARARTMLAPSLESPSSSLALAKLRDIARRAVEGRNFRRGDVVGLLQWLRAVVDVSEMEADTKRVVLAVLDASPQAVREDKAKDGAIKLHIDAASLASSLLAEFANVDGVGVYLRATVGAGYIYKSSHSTGAAAYEELGIAYRFNEGKVRSSAQVITSGLLFKIASTQQTEDSFLLAVGYSVNVYKLVDLSLNVGTMIPLSGGQVHLGVLAGVQIPIVDYITSLANGTPDVNVEAGVED